MPYAGLADTMAEFTRAHIISTLAQTKGVLSGRKGAAERLGLKRTTPQGRMRKLGITRNDCESGRYRRRSTLLLTSVSLVPGERQTHPRCGRRNASRFPDLAAVNLI